MAIALVCFKIKPSREKFLWFCREEIWSSCRSHFLGAAIKCFYVSHFFMSQKKSTAFTQLPPLYKCYMRNWFEEIWCSCLISHFHIHSPLTYFQKWLTVETARFSYFRSLISSPEEFPWHGKAWGDFTEVTLAHEDWQVSGFVPDAGNVRAEVYLLSLHWQGQLLIQQQGTGLQLLRQEEVSK